MIRLLTLALFLGLAKAALAGTPEKAAKSPMTVEPVHPMYLGSLNTGLKVNDAYTEGNFSIVAPVWSSLGADAILNGGVFFIEPYISWGEQGEVASSLGFGYRHLIGRQPVTALTKHDGHQASFLEEGVIVGGNLFLDMLDTETNHQFWQLGVGGEVLTRYLEVRGNYYIPLTDKKEVGTFRTQETIQNTSQQTSVVGAAPYATGNSVLQPYSQVTTQTTTTTTIERLFRRYEEGMEGWDLEVGVLLPWVDRYMDAKVIAGYYAFDNQPFGPQTGGAGNVEGWKAGLELRPVPALVFNSTWYEDERLTGGDWTASVRMEIPFEAGDLDDGLNLWSRIGESFKPRRRHLVERMAEPVRRQNAAVKLARSTEEDEGGQQTRVQKVTKVLSQSQGQIVLADDVVFVNNGPATANGIQAGSATGTGTAEKPVLTIQEGANLAGPRSTASGRLWSVYTQGVTTAYTGDVTLTGSTNFISSGKPLVGLSGRSFGAGAAPTLDGGFIATNVGTLGVTGYIIANGSSSTGDGIAATNVRTILLDSNVFVSASDDAVQVDTTGSTQTTLFVRDNIFDSISSDGLELTTTDSSRINAIVAGNWFHNVVGDGIDTDSDLDSRLALVAKNNLFSNGLSSGMDLQSFDDAVVSFTAIGNTFFAVDDDNIIFDAQDDSTFTAILQNNAFSDSGGDGITVAILGNARLTTTITDNYFYHMGLRGVEIGNFGDTTGTLTALVANNTFYLTLAEAVALGNFSVSSTLNATVVGNTIYGAISADGISLETELDSVTTATISRNSITGTGFSGIHADLYSASTVTLAVNGNSISYATDDGISLHVFDDAALTVTSLASNAISITGINGIDAYTDAATGTLRVQGFNGNTINMAAENGLNIEAAAGSTLQFNGTSNNSLGAQGLLRVDSTGAPSGTIRVNGNVIVLPFDLP